MAKRRKKRRVVKRKKARKSKRRKKSSGKNAWSAAKTRAYERAKRKLINHFKKAGATGKLTLGL